MGEFAGESAATGQNARVFLSYSRKDRAFAENLRDCLVRDGFDAFLDIRDIVKGEPWQERLQSLISGADVVLFLLSPDSVSSEVCDWEVNEAERLGKRIMPVVCRAVADETVPGRLRRLNYAFLEAEEKWPSEYLDLCKELNRDIAWVREHTRIAERATLWERNGRPRDEKVLSADELRDAREWQARRPVSVVLSEVCVAFLDASEAKNAEDRERLLTILGRAFVKPAEQALAEGHHDAALRLAAAGTVLGEDLDMRFVPERAPLVFLAADTPLRAMLCGHRGGVRSIGFCPDGTRIVTSSADKTARIWDAVTGRELLALNGNGTDVADASFSPCGGKVVTASLDGTARIWDARSGRELAVLRGHQDVVTIAVFSPDGKRVATASNEYLAKIWDSESGRELVTLRGHESKSSSRDHHELREFEFQSHRTPRSKFMQVEFSSDGKRLLTACDDATVRIWNAESGHQLVLLREEKNYDFLLCGQFSPDGRRCVTGSTAGVAQVWDVDSGQRVFALRHEAERRIWNARFSPDGKQILTTADNLCQIWTANDGAQIATLSGHESGVLSASYSSDSGRVVTASRDMTVRIWDASTGRMLKLLRGHEGAVRCAVFSCDGTRIVSASDAPEDNYVRVWDAAAGRAMSVMPIPGGVSLNVSFSPDAKRLTTLTDGTVRLWDAGTGRDIAGLQDSSAILSAVFSADSSRVLTISNDNSMRVWSAESGREIASIPVVKSEVDHPTLVAAFSPDGAQIATAWWTGKSIQIWDVASGGVSGVLNLQDSSASTIAFSPDRQDLVSGSFDGTARVWNISHGQEIARLDGNAGRVTTIAFSLDGARIAIGSERSRDSQTGERVEGGEVRLYDARSGAQLSVLSGHKDDISSVQFNGTGTQLLTASCDSIRAWNVSSGSELWALHASKENLLNAAYSPDGTLVAVASTNQTARVLDAATGDVIMRLDGHENSVTNIAFNFNGRRLLSSSLDQTVRIWDVASCEGLVSPTAEVLAAALSGGRGTITQRERADLLLQSVEDNDLGAVLSQRLAALQLSAADRVLKRAAILSRPLQSPCYLPASQRLAQVLIGSESAPKVVMPLAGETDSSNAHTERKQRRPTRSATVAVVALTVGALLLCATFYWPLLVPNIASAP